MIGHLNCSIVSSILQPGQSLTKGRWIRLLRIHSIWWGNLVIYRTYLIAVLLWITEPFDTQIQTVIYSTYPYTNCHSCYQATNCDNHLDIPIAHSSISAMKQNKTKVDLKHYRKILSHLWSYRCWWWKILLQQFLKQFLPFTFTHLYELVLSWICMKYLLLEIIQQLIKQSTFHHQ